MSGIDVFTWIVFLTIIAVVVLIFGFLGTWPGKVAKERKHPQAEAIQVASWVFLILGFAIWPFVLVWAYMRPIARPLDAEDVDAMARIAELEAELSILQAATEGGEAQ